MVIFKVGENLQYSNTCVWNYFQIVILALATGSQQKNHSDDHDYQQLLFLAHLGIKEYVPCCVKG